MLIIAINASDLRLFVVIWRFRFDRHE